MLGMTIKSIIENFNTEFDLKEAESFFAGKEVFVFVTSLPVSFYAFLKTLFLYGYNVLNFWLVIVLFVILIKYRNFS